MSTMNNFCTPLQVFEGSESGSPKTMRRFSQISDNSSGLSLDFHEYAIESSDESLHSTSSHEGFHRYSSLPQLIHGEPLTMDPPDALRSVEHENDKYNVLNPIPVFTDLLGSERYTHAEGSASSAMPEHFMNISNVTETANVASPTNTSENGNKHKSQLNPSGLQNKAASAEIRKSKSCHVANGNVSGKAYGVVYTSFQNLLPAAPATKSHDVSVIKSGLQTEAARQHDKKYDQDEQPLAQADWCSKNNERVESKGSNTISIVLNSVAESNPIDQEVIIQIWNHSEEEVCPSDTPTSVSGERQPLLEYEDQQTQLYSYTQFPANIPEQDPHDVPAIEDAVTQSVPEEQIGLRHVVFAEPPSNEDETVAPNANLEGSEDRKDELIPCCHQLYNSRLLRVKDVCPIALFVSLLQTMMTLSALSNPSKAIENFIIKMTFIILSVVVMVSLIWMLPDLMQRKLRCCTTTPQRFWHISGLIGNIFGLVVAITLMIAMLILAIILTSEYDQSKVTLDHGWATKAQRQAQYRALWKQILANATARIGNVTVTNSR